MDYQFWRNQKVLITGHTGFKGSWLSLWLQQLGAQVIGYSLNPPTDPSLFNVANVAKDMMSIIGDIRDNTFLTRTMQEFKPSIVIHLAAQSLVHHSYANPMETYSTNVMGTVSMLEAVRQTPSVRAVLNVTSDKCYENNEWLWGYRENEPMGGYDPYSSSKGCSELITASYRNSFFSSSKEMRPCVSIASARAGNVIGGGDWAANRIIPDIFRAISVGESAKIRNPHAIRPWQHVLDPLAGYLNLTQKLFLKGSSFGEAFNFGPPDAEVKTVQWIANQITRQWGGEAAWHCDDAAYPYEAHYLKLDSSKARETLGWNSRWCVSQALAATVDWYKAYQCNDDMRAFSLMQINKFQRSTSSS